MNYVIGIDLGGTKIAAALVDRDGNITTTAQRPTGVEQGKEFVLQQIVTVAEDVIAIGDVTRQQVAAVGLGSPGIIDPESGTVVGMTVNLPDWEGTPLKQILEDGLHLPAFVDNDVNVMTLGEWMFGAARGAQHLVFMAIGTGIGGGILIDGKLHHGARCTAAEVGHITIVADGPPCACGNYGCLEALASGPAIARRAREYVTKGVDTRLKRMVSAPDEITAEKVAEAARNGDELCRSIIEEAGRYIGIAAASLMNVLDPDCIVIGGGVAQIGDMLLEPARREVQRRALSPAPILQTKFGVEAGQIGAAALAWLGVER